MYSSVLNLCSSVLILCGSVLKLCSSVLNQGRCHACRVREGSIAQGQQLGPRDGGRNQVLGVTCQAEGVTKRKGVTKCKGVT